jgi:hypothetical protein
MIGVSIISIPVFLIGFFPDRFIVWKLPPVFTQTTILLLDALLIYPLFSFGICAIIIDDINTLPASWTSFLITRSNFLRLLPITSAPFLTRILLARLALVILTPSSFSTQLVWADLLTYPTYQQAINSPISAVTGVTIDTILLPITSGIFALWYSQYAHRQLYPALAQKQGAAYR